MTNRGRLLVFTTTPIAVLVAVLIVFLAMASALVAVVAATIDLAGDKLIEFMDWYEESGR